MMATLPDALPTDPADLQQYCVPLLAELGEKTLLIEKLSHHTADRSRAGPRAFLGDFRGALQADAYAGYDALHATGRVVEVGCWAHARRYFWEAKASDPMRALPALAFIQQLYAVETEAKGWEAAARGARRSEQAAPVLARFRPWLE